MCLSNNIATKWYKLFKRKYKTVHGLKRSNPQLTRLHRLGSAADLHRLCTHHDRLFVLVVDVRLNETLLQGELLLFNLARFLNERTGRAQGACGTK